MNKLKYYKRFIKSITLTGGAEDMAALELSKSLDDILSKKKELDAQNYSLSSQIEEIRANLNNPAFLELGYTEYFKRTLDVLKKEQSQIDKELCS